MLTVSVWNGCVSHAAALQRNRKTWHVSVPTANRPFAPISYEATAAPK
jgi:hypothetical protein